MQLYDITIAANTSRRLDAPGTYFYYYTGSAAGQDASITLQGVSSGLRINLKAGQAMRLPKGSPVETSWLIGNAANAATIYGTVIVGSGEITDNRITGSVEMIDGGKSRTYANQAFLAAFGCGNVAAQQPYVQLLNPAASGKNVILESLAFSSGAAGVVWGGIYSVALTTDNGVSAAYSKNGAGTVASVAHVRTANNAAQLFAASMIKLFLAASANQIINLREPIILPPGVGFAVTNATLNSDLTCTFEYYEENNT